MKIVLVRDQGDPVAMIVEEQDYKAEAIADELRNLTDEDEGLIDVEVYEPDKLEQVKALIAP
jgi:hypothetical protein